MQDTAPPNTDTELRGREEGGRLCCLHRKLLCRVLGLREK